MCAISLLLRRREEPRWKREGFIYSDTFGNRSERRVTKLEFCWRTASTARTLLSVRTLLKMQGKRAILFRHSATIVGSRKGTTFGPRGKNARGIQVPR